jgi:hypothetical protein
MTGLSKRDLEEFDYSNNMMLAGRNLPITGSFNLFVRRRKIFDENVFDLQQMVMAAQMKNNRVDNTKKIV